MATATRAKAPQNRPDDEAYLTISQTAEYLNLSLSTVQIMLRNKELPYFSFGRKSRRVRKSDLLKYTQSRLVK
jgi:excisionase family DNA binding protein